MSSIALPIGRKVPTRGNPARIVFWPGQPNSHGKNPAGKPLYRVVWSESRTYLIGGCWGDNNAIEYRWAPYYAGIKAWVLEKWLSPEEFAGTKQEWERSTINYQLAEHGIAIYAMGPYPAQGWYEHVYTFPADGEPNMEAIVSLLEEGKKYTFAQIKTALMLYHERQKKAWEDKVTDGIREAQPAFGWKPTSVSPSKPHSDTGGLSSPHAIRDAVERHAGDKPVFSESPEDLNLPERGFSIRQKKGE